MLIKLIRRRKIINVQHVKLACLSTAISVMRVVKVPFMTEWLLPQQILSKQSKKTSKTRSNDLKNSKVQKFLPKKSLDVMGNKYKKYRLDK